MDAPGKLIKSSTPSFIDRPRGKAVLETYPKSGQEDTVTISDSMMEPDDPKGSAITDTYKK